MSEKPIAFDAYQKLADSYAAKVDTKPHNAYYERPATLSLLPDVAGMDVLDAGCGPGVYTEILVELGATVVGIDASPRMIELARDRVGDRAEFEVADLSKPLDRFEAETFDLVLSPLVLDYVDDWRSVFREFFRVLKPGGYLLFSIHHPFMDFQYFKSENYYAIEKVGVEWSGFGEKVFMPSIRRPMEEVINPLAAAGFVIERMLEPRVTKELKATDPRHYAELSKQPCFLCVRARKR